MTASLVSTAMGPELKLSPSGIAAIEADHFMKCPGWGEWFDMRDLGQVLAHIHDEERDFRRFLLDLQT
jgi:hypothetical protein